MGMQQNKRNSAYCPWSPDGSKLLIQTYDDRPRPHLRPVHDPAGRDAAHPAITRTHKSDSFTGDWSPDGTRISYVHYQPAPAGRRPAARGRGRGADRAR